MVESFVERWLFRLSGEEVTDELAEAFEALGLSRIHENGEWLWTSSRFSSLANPGDVKDLAQELAAVLNGTLMMTIGNVRPLKISGILRTQEGKPPAQFIFPESVINESRFGILTLIRDGDPPPKKEDKFLYRFLAAADRSAAVNRVLKLVGSKELNWVNLYRIYEIISADVDSISQKGWASENDLTLFRRTANHPRSVGEEARHGVSPAEPPAYPMQLAEAEALLKGVIGKWIREQMG